MTMKERLARMDEIERRNNARISEYMKTCKTNKEATWQTGRNISGNTGRRTKTK